MRELGDQERRREVEFLRSRDLSRDRSRDRRLESRELLVLGSACKELSAGERRLVVVSK